jgi:DNA-binding transcriptional LysR family regulator
MRLEALRIFRDVVHEQSYTKAARKHFITQSAVSQQIRALEKRFGARLLTRRGGRWTLTEAGRVFHRGAGDVLAAVDRLEVNLRKHSTHPKGPLRVATAWSVGLYELPRAVRPFMERHPDVNLVVDYASAPSIYAQLLEDRCDVGIIVYARPRAGLRAIEFGHDRLALATGPKGPLAGRRTIDLEDLDGVPFIAFHPSLQTRRHTNEVFRVAGVAPKVVRAYANIEMIKSAVEANLGVAFIPADLMKTDERLRTIRVRGLSIERPLAAVVRGRRADDPLILAFIAALQRHFS